MKAIILAGGSGTRLWPLSRMSYPKQFLRLNGNKSLLQQTVERTNKVIPPKNIVVVTSNDYKFHVKADLKLLPHIHIIPEPEIKNTAPAMALGIRYCLDKLGCNKDEVVFVSPSDHIIKPADKFPIYLRQAEEIAKEGYIVTFGIKPSRIETGYGYIKVSDRPRVMGDGIEACRVEEFKEKPDTETAKKYVQEGNYYWNSGMFLFSIGTIIEEFEKLPSEIKEMFSLSFDEMLAEFSRMPDISIDHAIAEKSERIVTLPLEIYWQDIGSWDSLYDILDKDKDGNVKNGNIVSIETKRTMMIGNKRLISTIGLEDSVIIETDDAVLVAKKGETQKVREIVNKLKWDRRKEGLEHAINYRPWGSYTVLEDGPKYKIKKIQVNPNEKISLQMHRNRSEHWIVISGTAKIVIGNKEKFIHENESEYIPKLTIHRLENLGNIPLEIIEVQNGEYLEEDDIIRFDDMYGR